MCGSNFYESDVILSQLGITPFSAVPYLVWSTNRTFKYWGFEKFQFQTLSKDLEPKVIIHKSRVEVSLLEQDTIDYVST
jgi:hypothetical protein